MKVVLEMDWSEAKKHLDDTSLGYKSGGERVAYLNFTERVWEHNYECDEKEHVSGKICPNRTERTVDYSFRVLEITP